MPRLVTPDLLARWRRLSVEGMSFTRIGKETGWDERTVAKHLKQDVRVGEIDKIRQDLLKERLGRHWDMLIEETREALSHLTAYDPWEFIERIKEPEVIEFTISGGSVSAGPDGRDLVRANAHDLRSYQLLEQHLPHDPLWGLVERWEEAMARNFHTRRALYALVAPSLQNAADWPITAREEGQEPSWRIEAVNLVYEEALVRAARIQRQGFSSERCREMEGGLIHAGTIPVAHAPGAVDQVRETLARCIVQIVDTDEAAQAMHAFEESKELVQQIGLALDDLRLLTYLPGVCSVCGRVQL